MAHATTVTGPRAPPRPYSGREPPRVPRRRRGRAVRAARTRTPSGPVALVTCDAESRLAVVDLRTLRIVGSIATLADPRSVERVGDVCARLPHRGRRAVDRRPLARAPRRARLRRAAVHGRASRRRSRVRHRLGAKRRRDRRHPSRRRGRPRAAAGLGAPPDDLARRLAALGRARLRVRARRRRRRRRRSATSRDLDARVPRARRRARAGRPAVDHVGQRAACSRSASRTHSADRAPQHVTFGNGRAFVTSGDSGNAARPGARRPRALARAVSDRVVQRAVRRGPRDHAVAVARDARGARRARDGRSRTLHVAGSCHDACVSLRIYESLTASSVDLRARVGNMGASEAGRSPHPCRRRVAAVRACRPPAAAVPCRDRIYNDWYHGRQDRDDVSDRVLPRRAQARAGRTRAMYSSLADDIRAAHAGRARAHEGPHEGAGADRHGRSAATRRDTAALDEAEHAAARSVAGQRAGEQHAADARRSPPARRAAAGAAFPCRCSCSAVSRCCSRRSARVGVIAKRRRTLAAARAAAAARARPAGRSRAARARAGTRRRAGATARADRCAARAATVRPTAAPTAVTTRRHWYATG